MNRRMYALNGMGKHDGRAVSGKVSNRPADQDNDDVDGREGDSFSNGRKDQEGRASANAMRGCACVDGRSSSNGTAIGINPDGRMGANGSSKSQDGR